MQRAIEKAGVPTICVTALPPVSRQNGTTRAAAPLVPMGANAGAPHDVAMQRGITIDALKLIETIETPGKIVPLPYEYHAQI